MTVTETVKLDRVDVANAGEAHQSLVDDVINRLKTSEGFTVGADLRVVVSPFTWDGSHFVTAVSVTDEGV